MLPSPSDPAAHPRARVVRVILDEASALLLAPQCGGCGIPGTTLCARCTGLLRPVAVRRRTPSGRTVDGGLVFDGVAAHVIRAIKEGGRTTLLGALDPAVRDAVWRAAGESGLVVDALVPLPTSRRAFRRRGYRVPRLLAARTGAVVLPVLAPRRTVADQRGLGREERRRNVAGSLRATRRGTGRRVVVVDDVATTGATLDEAARALEEAGFVVAGCAVAAVTPRETPR